MSLTVARTRQPKSENSKANLNLIARILDQTAKEGERT
jgi:hypothetical protein